MLLPYRRSASTATKPYRMLAVPPWAGIIRISHLGDRQIGSDSLHSDKTQEKAIRSAVPPGHSIEILPPEYDISGGLPLTQRPSLHKAVLGVEAGKYAGIVVAYQSRLFRHTTEEEAVFARVEAAGGEIIMALDPVDNRTVDGRMVRRIKSAMNVAERERHAEAFEEAAREATEHGIWQRRQIPIGYTKDPVTRRLVVEPVAAARVHRAFADRVGGKPISAIASDLGRSANGVRNMLRNRLYLGELRVRSYVNPSAHPRIVSEDLFEAVQYARVTRPAKAREHPALLASLIRCSGCGHVMPRSGPAYSCQPDHSDGRCPAPAAITMRIADGHVERIALAELAALSTRRVANDSHLPRLRSDVRDAERELGAYLEAVAAAGISAESFAAGARKRQDAIDAARAELDAALVARPARIDGEAVAIWPSLNGTERNHLLSGLVEAVVVRKVGRGRTVAPAERLRILKHGAGVFRAYAWAGNALPLVAFWPDADDPRCLRAAGGEDTLKRRSG